MKWDSLKGKNDILRPYATEGQDSRSWGERLCLVLQDNEGNKARNLSQTKGEDRNDVNM